MAIEDSLRNEQTMLRAELQELKRCQLNYFLLSVAGGGAILGLGDGFPLSGDAKLAVFLIPVVIVIPCWMTFFDKATTITRLVGFTRVWIEEQLRSPAPQYLGYETALSYFRGQEEFDEKNPADKRRGVPILERWHGIPVVGAKEVKMRQVFGLRHRHRYWMINWYTFFFLSVLSLAVPILFSIFGSPQTATWWLPIAEIVAAIAVLFSAWFTFRIVITLIYGKYSYDYVTAYWRTCGKAPQSSTPAHSTQSAT